MSDLNDIYIKHITYVSNDFHARFSAKKRLYRYLFKTTRPSVFEQTYVSYYEKFDPYILQKALKLFEGKHDFKYFKKTGSETHTDVREVYFTKYKTIHGYHFIYFQANGFLRSQVRMMIDMAMACAQKKKTLTQLEEQLNGAKRHSSKLAPQEGLYLAKVLY